MKVDRTVMVRSVKARKAETIRYVYRLGEHIMTVDCYDHKNFLWHVVRHSDDRIVAWGFPARAAAVARALAIAAEEDDWRSLRWAGAGA
jgi:hypothetical protein